MYNDLTGQVEQVYSPTLRAISPSPGSGMGSSMGMADGMPYASTPQSRYAPVCISVTLFNPAYLPVSVCVAKLAKTKY